MNTVYKTKSQLRTETSEAIESFLSKGGTIEIVPAKKMRRRTTQKMSSKSSKGYNTGSSGFATGYPRKAL
jgi:hypothetical protein